MSATSSSSSYNQYQQQQQHQYFPLDSVLLQNNLIKMSLSADKTESFHLSDSCVHETVCLHPHPPTDGSSLSYAFPHSHSNSNSNSQDAIESRCRKQRNWRKLKVGDGVNVKKVKTEKKDEHKIPVPEGYIHVRAKRGQATDSHSLAERIRREKISERMKILQTLVPGCDKVTGKALMLDEIINYVQSLQNQVEFLSMKLASINNPVLYNFGMDFDLYAGRPENEISSGIGIVSQPQLPYMPVIQSQLELDNSSAFLLEHEITNTSLLNLDLDEVSLLLNGEEDRQKLINSNGLFSNDSYFFH